MNRTRIIKSTDRGSNSSTGHIRVKALAIWLFLFSVPFPCFADDAPRAFYALSDLTYDRNAKPVLINARAANPADFPAIFYSFTTSGSCTSTLVGVKVLLTAAHCVPNGGKVTIEKAGTQFSGICTQAKEYVSNLSADWALCALNDEPSNVIHETINSNNNVVQKGTVLLLSGFGCVTTAGIGGNDGVYRIGTSTVSSVPANDNNDLETTGGAAVCYGDSGGPAFLVSPQAIANPGAPQVLVNRLMVSVNSRGNIRDTSILVSTSTPTAQGFLKSWTQASGLKVCGFNSDATSCRSWP